MNAAGLLPPVPAHRGAILGSAAVAWLAVVLVVVGRLKARERRPVLVEMGFPARLFETDGRKRYAYRRLPTWTSAEWERFRTSSKRVGTWWSPRKDENFDLYEIR